MIVDQHQPVVEKYYGSGKMSSVIERLLEECDRVVKKHMDGWEEDRSMKRKVNFRHLRYWITESSSWPLKAYRCIEFDVFELFSDNSTASFSRQCS